MKALSIRQPWADLILEELKRMEVRSWKKSYRGRLLIHAGRKIDKEAMLRFKGWLLDYQKPYLGCLLGTAEVTGIVELNEHNWESLRAEHLNWWPYEGIYPLYGWIFTNPERFEKPIPYKGKLGLFDVRMAE